MKWKFVAFFKFKRVKLGWGELDSPLESARGERKRRDRNEHAAQGTRKMAPATALKDAIKNFEAAKGVKAAETEGEALPGAYSRRLAPPGTATHPLGPPGTRSLTSPHLLPPRNSVARTDLRSSSTARSLPS